MRFKSLVCVAVLFGVVSLFAQATTEPKSGPGARNGSGSHSGPGRPHRRPKLLLPRPRHLRQWLPRLQPLLRHRSAATSRPESRPPCTAWA